MQASFHLGNHNANYCFYLPNAPLASSDITEQPALSADIIANNGNHWRKILTIMAKVCAPDDNWKHYRDQVLLTETEQIIIAPKQLESHAKWHFICGQHAADDLSQHLSQSLQLTLSDARQDSESEKLYRLGRNVILLPYLDYRQLPNADIARLRDIIHSSSQP